MSNYPKYNDIMGYGAGPSINPRPRTLTESELIANREHYRNYINGNRMGVRLPRESRDSIDHGLSQTSEASSRRDARLDELLESVERNAMGLEDNMNRQQNNPLQRMFRR